MRIFSVRWQCLADHMLEYTGPVRLRDTPIGCWSTLVNIFSMAAEIQLISVYSSTGYACVQSKKQHKRGGKKLRKGKKKRGEEGDSYRITSHELRARRLTSKLWLRFTLVINKKMTVTLLVRTASAR